MVRKNFRGIMIRMLFCLVFMAGFMLPSHVVFAAMCSGDDCTGLFADSTCTAYSGLTPFTYNDAYIEPRSSNVCNAQWTRVTNKASSSMWTAGSTRYGGADFTPYYQPGQSAAAISTNQYIYTRMYGNDLGTGVIDALGCGEVNSTQMTLPIGGSQPINSPYCSGVW